MARKYSTSRKNAMRTRKKHITKKVLAIETATILRANVHTHSVVILIISSSKAVEAVPMMSSCSDNETLLDLVIRGRWSALCGRAETHPQELSCVGDHDGMTVFHWVCVNDAPVRTLRFLLRQDEMRASLWK